MDNILLWSLVIIVIIAFIVTVIAASISSARESREENSGDLDTYGESADWRMFKDLK